MPYITLAVAPGQSLEQATRTEYKRPPDYHALRACVAGPIEAVPHLTSILLNGQRVRCQAYANEEGRLTLPRNDAMSALWKAELLRQNPRAEFRYEPELFGTVCFVIKINREAK